MTCQFASRVRALTHIFRVRAEIGWGQVSAGSYLYKEGRVYRSTHGRLDRIPGPKLTTTTETNEGLTSQRRVTEAGVSP